MKILRVFKNLKILALQHAITNEHFTRGGIKGRRKKSARAMGIIHSEEQTQAQQIPSQINSVTQRENQIFERKNLEKQS